VPAHLRWREHSPIDNRRRWSGYDWVRRGEEWNASPEWKQALIKRRACPLDPSGRGYARDRAGRRTLVAGSGGARLVLVDVSEQPLKLCRERFNGDTRILYILSSGSDLPGVEDGSIDAVWSFDVSFTWRRAIKPTLRRSRVCLRPAAQQLCTTPTGATVANCRPAAVGVHRCRTIYSLRWRSSADCKSSASLTLGDPVDALT
jgi:Methyltransferase domain